MKQITLLAVSVFILNNELLADDSKSFFGVDAVRNSVKINNTLHNNITTTTEHYNSINLDLGTTNDKKNQYFTYSKIYSKQKMSYQSLTFNYDRMLIKQNNLAIYLGVNLGYGIAKNDNNSSTAVEYGVKGGFLYDVNKDTQLNIGIKQTIPTSEVNNNYVNRAWSFYIGINTKFQHLLY